MKKKKINIKDAKGLNVFERITTEGLSFKYYFITHFWNSSDLAIRSTDTGSVFFFTKLFKGDLVSIR